MVTVVRWYVKGFLYLVQNENLNDITLSIVPYLVLSCLIFRLLQLPPYDFNPEDAVISYFLRRLFNMVKDMIYDIGFFNINSMFRYYRKNMCQEWEQWPYSGTSLPPLRGLVLVEGLSLWRHNSRHSSTRVSKLTE